MTVIGKILTFIIFFLSLVFLGMAISINALNKDPKTKQSWYHVAERMRTQEIPALHKDILERDNIIIKHQADITKLTKELEEAKKNWKDEVRQARDEASASKAEADLAKTKFEKAQAALDSALVELQKRRDEVVALLETIKKKDVAMADLQGTLTKTINEKTSALVAAQTYFDRVKALTKHNEELVKIIEDQQQRATETAAASKELVRRPPPDDVRGQVKAVTPEGLVSISIGSDAGLLKGHTLEVYRTEPKPQYLGVIQIVEVAPHEAVGKLLTPQFKKLVQPSDVVASRILPPR
jgi:hypothetical protein